MIQLYISTKILILGLLVIASSLPAFSQIDLQRKRREDYPIRFILNKFSINLSTGYGKTFYRSEITDYAYIRTEDGSFIFDNNTEIINGQPIDAYSDWFSDVATDQIFLTDNSFEVPYQPIGNPVNNPLLHDNYDLIRPDSVPVLLKNTGNSIPITLALYLNLKRVRIGGGLTADFHRAWYPEPDEFFSKFPDPNGKTKTLMMRYFGLIGVSIYEYLDYALAADLRFGKINMGKGFNKDVVSNSSFINIGARIENVFSEYFRIFVRPSVEFKSYSVNLAGGDANVKNIDYKNPTFFVEFGISLNYPDLPRSPLKNDKIQMKHFLSDPKSGTRKEFRGQPIWKKQDPKAGELYPELLKKKDKKL